MIDTTWLVHFFIKIKSTSSSMKVSKKIGRYIIMNYWIVISFIHAMLTSKSLLFIEDKNILNLEFSFLVRSRMSQFSKAEMHAVMICKSSVSNIIETITVDVTYFYKGFIFVTIISWKVMWI